jgi:signal transduction histidine kinase
MENHFLKVTFFMIALVLAGNFSVLSSQSLDQITDEDLANMPKDSAKMRLLSDLAWEIKAKESAKALDYVNEALEIANTLNLTKGKADITHDKGMVFWYQGNYEQASKFFFDALAQREKLGDKLGLSRSYNNIGNVFFHQEDYEQAFEYYSLGLKMREELKDSVGLIYSYNNLADVALKRRDFDGALKNYQIAQSYGEATGHQGGLSFVLQNMGLLYKEKSQIDSALYYFNKSLPLAEAIEDKNKVSFLLNQIARVDLDNRNYSDALDLGKRSFRYGNEAGAKDKMRDACEILSVAYAGVGNYEEAFLEMQKFKKLDEEIAGEDKEKAIFEITSKYETAKKEAEILSQKTELLENEKKVNRLTIFIFILIFLTIVLVALGLFFRYRLQIQNAKMLRQKNKQIEAQNEKLIRSNSALEQFAYVASHDLKEPLRNISSFSSLLKRNYESKLDQTGKDYIGIITNGVRHMSALLEDVLAYSRLTQNTLTRDEDINMNEVVASVKETLEQVIEEKNVLITSDDLPKVKSNSIQMYQLLQNLISNGIKFNDKPKPTVHVGYIRENGLHHFTVTDNGIGINQEYENKIFQIFQRLHKKEEYTGTGIGLAICERIVKQHGGEIWLESQGDNGSTFHFTLIANN